MAAMKSGMDRKTATKYLKAKVLPSQTKNKVRTYRTRVDPFEADWPLIHTMLTDAPELEAKALFEHLVVTKGGYQENQLRTLQRRVKRWRATYGPDKEVFFPQCHVPGEAAQTDFTWCTELEITIAGEDFPHMLCHTVLPYSNWSWVTICQSESMIALRNGVQNAVFELGCIPEWHQMDNSTAATHSLKTSGRAYNREYIDFMKHLGMKPRSIAIGQSNQNGDVEALNGALKRRLKQHLILRQTKDFSGISEYQTWLNDVMTASNALRPRIKEELTSMRPLVAARLLDYRVVDIRVSKWSLIRVLNNSYSLTSRLIGEKVRVHIHENRLQVWYAGKLEEEMERLRGRNNHLVNYRHVISSLVKKPGAFRGYRYRESFFPSLVFRKTYDLLRENHSERKADLEYLRILNTAALTMESEVEVALELLLEAKDVPNNTVVKALVEEKLTPKIQDIKPYTVSLETYDDHIQREAA